MNGNRSFKFDFYIGLWKCVPPPEAKLVPRMVKLISTMRGLESLELLIECCHWQAEVAPDFQREFKHNNLVLPTVRTLIFPRYFEWLVTRCPNVRRIVIKDRWSHDDMFTGLMKTVGTAKGVEYFEIDAREDKQLALGMHALNARWR